MGGRLMARAGAGGREQAREQTAASRPRSNWSMWGWCGTRRSPGWRRAWPARCWRGCPRWSRRHAGPTRSRTRWIQKPSALACRSLTPAPCGPATNRRGPGRIQASSIIARSASRRLGDGAAGRGSRGEHGHRLEPASCRPARSRPLVGVPAMCSRPPRRSARDRAETARAWSASERRCWTRAAAMMPTAWRMDPYDRVGDDVHLKTHGFGKATGDRAACRERRREVIAVIAVYSGRSAESRRRPDLTTSLRLRPAAARIRLTFSNERRTSPSMVSGTSLPASSTEAWPTRTRTRPLFRPGERQVAGRHARLADRLKRHLRSRKNVPAGLCSAREQRQARAGCEEGRREETVPSSFLGPHPPRNRHSAGADSAIALPSYSGDPSGRRWSGSA